MIKKYVCKVCNYSSDIHCNYKKHIKSKKHLMLAQSKPIDSPKLAVDLYFKCNTCGQHFKHKSSKSRHSAKCKKLAYKSINNHLKQVTKNHQKNNKIEVQEEKIKMISEEKERYKRMVEYLTRQLEKVTTMAISKPTNITNNNTINFIAQNYTEAHELKSLNDYSKLLKINNQTKTSTNENDNDNDNDDEETGIEKVFDPLDELFDDYDSDENIIKENFIKDIVLYKNLKSLHSVLGDFIIQNYVKEDKSKQSLHVTDSSRMKFIYATLKSELKKIQWKTDPKGVNIGKIIIDPMLEYIHTQIYNYREKLANKFKIKPKNVNNADLDMMASCQTIISMIAKENKKSKTYDLKQKIIEYIIPHFEFNKPTIEY